MTARRAASRFLSGILIASFFSAGLVSFLSLSAGLVSFLSLSAGLVSFLSLSAGLVSFLSLSAGLVSFLILSPGLFSFLFFLAGLSLSWAPSGTVSDASNIVRPMTRAWKIERILMEHLLLQPQWGCCFWYEMRGLRSRSEAEANRPRNTRKSRNAPSDNGDPFA